MTKHLIIGAGPAGVVAAETLRDTDPESSVTMVGGEPGAPYSRMAIPYVLTGRIDEDGTRLRPDDGHWDRIGVALKAGPVASISTKERAATLAGGEVLEWDRLLIASGARPVRPDIPGLDHERVRHCWTLDDARAIAAHAKKGARAVVIGAGFIGSIVMEALYERGVEVVMIEAADRMAARMLDETAAAMLKRWCEGLGVRVLTGQTVAGVAEAGDGLKVSLAGGDALQADVVVVAAGVAPNVDFLADSGIEIDAGVLVDDRMKTGANGVYAAGDVAQGRDFSTGGRVVNAVQPVAVDQGRTAALNMAGVDAVYGGGLAMNVLETMGLVSSAFGDWRGKGDSARVEGDDKYMRVEFEGDRLIGAVSVGRTDHIGALRGLIQARIRLGPWKERLKTDPTRIAEAFVARIHG